MTSMIIPAVTALVLIALGLFLLVKPSICQRWNTESFRKNPRAAKINPFAGFIASPDFIPFLRMMGLVALLMALLVILLMI